MTSDCENLDTFFDGELPADAAQQFRLHLATCARCQGALRGLMLEAAIVEDAPASDARVAQRAPRRWWPWLAMLVPAAACAALLAWHGIPGRSELAPVVELALASERGPEVRFSEPALDRWRPHRVVRAAGTLAPESIGIAALSDFETRRQWNALAAAHALRGELASAIAAAKRLPGDARSLSDRAALELLTVEGAAEPVAMPRQLQAAERALSLAAEALRLEPGNVQALWNRAIALKRLRLPLVAAQVFDDIAARREPGWSGEAGDNAARLRADYREDHDKLQQVRTAAAAMVTGGPPIAAALVEHAPSQARNALYQAIATAATTERLDALTPVARAADQAFATTAMAALIERVRRSDMARRAPVAQALRAFIAERQPVDRINAIRAHALELRIADIALASFLAISDASTDAGDLAQLATLTAGQADDWWRVFEIMRRTYHLEYRDRDPARANDMARTAAPLCRTPSLLCERIAMFQGAASADLGRLDAALEQLGAARQMAHQPASRDDEALTLDVIAQVTAMRVQDAIDAVAVSDAYFTEYALRLGGCEAPLQRLDFVAMAALDRHRYREAAAFRAQADALERGTCRDEPLRLNGETVRLRLALGGHGELAAHKLDTLETDRRDNQSSYIRYLRAAATITSDRAGGEAALRRVIADADAHPDAPFAALARSTAYATLIEVAAHAREADGVLALLADQMRVAAPERCMVGIAQWNQVVVAVRGAAGDRLLETREVPERQLALAAGDVVSPAQRAALAGCPRVEVLTQGRYFGMAGVLDPTLAWAYKSASPARPPRPGAGELVVSDVAPPDELHLPPLRSFQGAPTAASLRGTAATPAATLDRMRAAGLIVIVAHGLTDTREPDAASLILSPDRSGEYLLTAAKVSTAKLDGAPIVVLAGCHAGRTQVSSEPWSLATAFRAAGARAVIAPTQEIPDDDASAAFQSLVDRIRAGADPVDALRGERAARGPSAAWLSSIVVFD